MSNTKHTPGPWFAVEYAGFWNIQQSPYYDEHVNLLDADNVGVEQAAANAKIMAASLGLLEVTILANVFEKNSEFVYKEVLYSGISARNQLQILREIAIKNATE